MTSKGFCFPVDDTVACPEVEIASHPASAITGPGTGSISITAQNEEHDKLMRELDRFDFSYKVGLEMENPQSEAVTNMGLNDTFSLKPTITDNIGGGEDDLEREFGTSEYSSNRDDYSGPEEGSPQPGSDVCEGGVALPDPYNRTDNHGPKGVNSQPEVGTHELGTPLVFSFNPSGTQPVFDNAHNPGPYSTDNPGPKGVNSQPKFGIYKFGTQPVYDNAHNPGPYSTDNTGPKGGSPQPEPHYVFTFSMPCGVTNLMSVIDEAQNPLHNPDTEDDTKEDTSEGDDNLTGNSSVAGADRTDSHDFFSDQNYISSLEYKNERLEKRLGQEKEKALKAKAETLKAKSEILEAKAEIERLKQNEREFRDLSYQIDSIKSVVNKKRRLIFSEPM